MIGCYYKNWKVEENIDSYDISDINGELKLATVVTAVQIQLHFLSSDIIVMSTNNPDDFKLE